MVPPMAYLQTSPCGLPSGGIDLILQSMRNFPRSIDLLTRANAALCNLAANVDNTVLIAEKGLPVAFRELPLPWFP